MQIWLSVPICYSVFYPRCESKLLVALCGWSHLPANGWRYRCDASLSLLRWMRHAGTFCSHLTDKPSHDCLAQPQLNLDLLADLTFLGLHQHCFQFLNGDSQRHKEISWLSKRKSWLKLHAGAFCHYRAITAHMLTIQFLIMEMN